MDVVVDDVSKITGDMEKDNLRVYLQGLYYDCTFRIASKDGSHQVLFSSISSLLLAICVHVNTCR